MLGRSPMAKTIREAILEHLGTLPQGRSIFPTDLAQATGLTEEQVNRSVSAAKKNGEVIVREDGSIAIRPPQRGIGDMMNNLWTTLREATKSVPAVKYALGLAGVAAAAGIIRAFLTDPRVAVFGILIMLIL